jgi:hypothetical protein
MKVYRKIGNFRPYSYFISYLIYSQSSISVILNFYSIYMFGDTPEYKKN